MSNREIQMTLQNFISEIKNCMSREAARDIQRRIEEFYNSHSIPEESDILLQSGFCELLSMIAG